MLPLRSLRSFAPLRENSSKRLQWLGLVIALDWSIASTFALLVVLGFGLRVTQLGAIGFAEHEMNKLNANYED